MLWHLLAVLGALAFVLELGAVTAALVAYRRHGGEQLARDMRAAKRMTGAGVKAPPRGATATKAPPR